jgi:hypothetical protein
MENHRALTVWKVGAARLGLLSGLEPRFSPIAFMGQKLWSVRVPKCSGVSGYAPPAMAWRISGGWNSLRHTVVTVCKAGDVRW